MLVLTRSAGETLLIGDDVEVTVLAVTGGQVKIGIKAPKEIPIVRSELLARDQAKEQAHG